MLIKKISTDYLMYMAQNKELDPKIIEDIKKLDRYNSVALRKKLSTLFLPFSEGIVGASVILDFFWAIFFLTSLSITMMLGLIALLGASTIILGLGLTWKFYQTRNKEISKLDTDLTEALGMEMIYQELLARKRNTLIKKARRVWEKILPFSNDNKRINEAFQNHGINIDAMNEEILYKFGCNKKLQLELIQIIAGVDSLPRMEIQPFLTKELLFQAPKAFDYKSAIQKSIVAGIPIILALFGSFFVCSTYVLIGLGLASTAAILSNPITISIALGITLLYGAYYTYKSYNHVKVKYQMKQIITQKTQSIENLKYNLHNTEKVISSLERMESKLDSFTPAENTSSYRFFTQPSRKKQPAITLSPDNFSENNGTQIPTLN